MADRIDAGVFAMAAAITGGELSLVGANLEHFGVARWKLEQMGVEFAANGAVLQVRRERPLRPINVITSPYPGFATDLQSPIMALSCLADGTSYLRETIYDGRFTLAGELDQDGRRGRGGRQRGHRARPVPAQGDQGDRARPAHRRWRSSWPGWARKERRWSPPAT